MPSAITPPPVPPKAGIEIAIDRGGTFTDCIATNIPGRDDIVVKLLSVDPSNYEDAPTVSAPEALSRVAQMIDVEQEGIRRILELVTGEKLNRGAPIDTSGIGKFLDIKCSTIRAKLTTSSSFNQDGDHSSHKCLIGKISRYMRSGRLQRPQRSTQDRRSDET